MSWRWYDDTRMNAEVLENKKRPARSKRFK